jgi:hypothetical protein
MKTVLHIQHKRFALGVLILEAVVLLLIMIGYLLPRETASYQAEQLLIQGENMQAQAGNYIDSTYSSAGKYVASPEMKLSSGIYTAEVSYRYQIPDWSQMEGIPGNKLWSTAAMTGTVIPSGITVDSINLLPQDNYIPADTDGSLRTISYRFKVNMNHIDVQIENHLGDAYNDSHPGYLQVMAISVTYRPKLSALHALICWEIVFVILDVIAAIAVNLSHLKDWTRKHIGVVTILGVVLFLAQMPAMEDYLIDGSDINFHIYRIASIAEGLLAGQFPVRIQPDWMNGYGYATGIMYGDALLYLPALLFASGFSIVTCYHFYILLVNVLTLLVIYHIAVHISDGQQYVSAAATAFYMLNPYRICDIYQRAAVGEYTALLFLPIVAYGLWKIYLESDRNKNNGWKWLAVGFCGLITSHVLSTMIAAIFVLLTCIILIRKTFTKRVFLQLIQSVFSAALMSVFFWLPFVQYYRTVDMRVKNEEAATISSTAIYLAQLFGMGYDANGENKPYTMMGDSMTILGTFAGVVLLLSVVLLFTGFFYGKRKAAVIVLLVISALSIWVSTDLFPHDRFSYYLPRLYRVIQSVQFAWRFHALSTTTITFLMILTLGSGYEYFRKTVRTEWKIEHVPQLLRIATAVICVACVGIPALVYEGRYVSEVSPVTSYYDIHGTSSFQQSGGEYVPLRAENYRNTEILISNTAAVSAAIASRDGVALQVNVTNASNKEQYMDLPVFYYPGYTATANGEMLHVLEGAEARLRVVLPAGYQGEIDITFVEPIYWRVAELVSLLFAIGLLCCSLERSLNPLCHRRTKQQRQK